MQSTLLLLLWISPSPLSLSSSCFLCSSASMAELFFGLPSARLALGQLLSVSAGGFRDSEGGEEDSLLEKKEGGVQQGLCTDISFCRPTATVLQHSKERSGKKRASLLIILFLFVQLVVGGMSV